MQRLAARSCPYVIAAILVSAWSWPSVGAGAAGGKTSAAEHGRELFRIYCANCHGSSGRGDGPTASVLKVRPTDLTRLARGNGGAFPEREVWSTIDGRESLPSHGSREMPIWGLAFQDPGRDVGQEDEVRARIGWLVEYLRSIQDPPATSTPAEGPSD